MSISKKTIKQQIEMFKKSFFQSPNLLSMGDLLMADRYYCTFAMIALSQAKKIPVLFQVHASKKVDFRVVPYIDISY